MAGVTNNDDRRWLGRSSAARASNARSAHVKQGRGVRLELLTEHDYLDVFLESAETTDTEQLDGATDQTEEEREGHGGEVRR